MMNEQAMTGIELRGHTVSKGACTGVALVSQEPISFMGGVDPTSGIIVEAQHPLHGVCVSGLVLIFPYGKGSTVGSYILYEMCFENTAPKAIINLRADPIVAIGAIIGGIPMIDRVTPNPLTVITTGDTVLVDATAGKITLLKRNSGSLAAF